MNITNQVIILSAERSANTHEGNRQRTELLSSMIEDLKIPFNKAEGVFNGISQASFVCIVKNDEEIQALKDFAFVNFNQDAVLYQDANQQASLIFKNGETRDMGRLEQVNNTDGLENYTILKGNIYTTVPRKVGSSVVS